MNRLIFLGVSTVGTLYARRGGRAGGRKPPLQSEGFITDVEGIKVGGKLCVKVHLLHATAYGNAPEGNNIHIPDGEKIAEYVIRYEDGKTETIPIKSLSFGARGMSQAYWTEPGTYTLGATYATAIAPPPPGTKDAGEGFGRVTLTAAPIEIKVQAK